MLIGDISSLIWLYHGAPVSLLCFNSTAHVIVVKCRGWNTHFLLCIIPLQNYIHANVVLACLILILFHIKIITLYVYSDVRNYTPSNWDMLPRVHRDGIRQSVKMLVYIIIVDYFMHLSRTVTHSDTHELPLLAFSNWSFPPSIPTSSFRLIITPQGHSSECYGMALKNGPFPLWQKQHLCQGWGGRRRPSCRPWLHHRICICICLAYVQYITVIIACLCVSLFTATLTQESLKLRGEPPVDE